MDAPFTPSPPPPDPFAQGAKGAANSAILRLKRALRPALLLIAVAFVGYTGWQLALRWRESRSVHVEPIALTLSLLPLLAATIFQARAWVFVVERLAGHQVPRGKALTLYFDSLLARYAGKLGLPALRMAGASSIGTSAGLVGVSIVLEMLSWVAVGGTVGFGLSWATGSLARLPILHTWLAPCALGGSVLMLFGMSLVPLKRYPKFAQRSLRGQADLPLVSWHTPLNQLWYWLAWAGHGALIARALGADGAGAIQAAGLFPLATVAGFMVLVTPGGLGMREAVLALGLIPTLGGSAAVAAAILSRICSFLAEILVWSGARLASSKERRPLDL